MLPSAARLAVLLALLSSIAVSLSYDPYYARWNLNQNQSATNPADYWGEWENHTYNPSPANWRFPFYILTRDRFVDGDPSNNQINGTGFFQHDWMSDQFRFGGDVRGIINSLDYLQGMGIRAIYLSGSPFLNFPWSSDDYGPLDFTLLDAHGGDIQDWRDMVTAVHARGMYVIMDNTVSTMGNLLGMQGYVNSTTTAPFNWGEYDYTWKLADRRYHDFIPSNEINASCVYPRMWGVDGYPMAESILENEKGCRASDFDSYGEEPGIGDFPTYRNQLSKFASVQDRLREWNPSVLERIMVMSCMQIAMFDLDGFRIDKGVQITIDALAEFSSYQRDCARRYGKENFLIIGEVVATPEVASVYIGRGKQPDQTFSNTTKASMATGNTTSPPYIREFGNSALDAAAFDYNVYGAMTRFLGMNGAIGTLGVDFVEFWNRILRGNDMVNANTGEFDPRQVFGMTNQDVTRWPSLIQGSHRQLLGHFITMVEMPGIPQIMYGEEQNAYILENLASNYVYGRQPMASQRAWQLHGCYVLSETVYVDIDFSPARDGCNDMSVSLDHRDPAHPVRNVLKRMWELRRQYPTLNDGFNLTALSQKYTNVYLEGSNGVPSPHGIWSVYRGRQENVQDLAGEGQGNQGVWLLYHNQDSVIDYEFECAGNSNQSALVAAFPTGTTVKNLFYPYEEHVLIASSYKYGIEQSTEFNGCLANITMEPWAFKAFVPLSAWVDPAPTITEFLPGHDARLLSTVDLGEKESVPFQIFFSREMDCTSVTNNLEITSDTEDGSLAQLNTSSIICSNVTANVISYPGQMPNSWSFEADLMNVANGVHTISVRNASTVDGTSQTGAMDTFMLRIGQPENPVVFPWTGNYSTNILHEQETTGELYLTLRAPGATKFRYSTNWGSNYSGWFDYTNENTTITPQGWSGTKDQEWTGDHVVLNFWSPTIGSADHYQHADVNYNGKYPRRWPHAWVQGPFNQYGYDGGLQDQMTLSEDDGKWSFDLVAEWPSEFLVNVWGMNPDGFPDKTQAFGDVDGDGVLDQLPPDTLARNVINASRPIGRYLGHRIQVNDGNYSYTLVPFGNAWLQLVLGLLLAIIVPGAGVFAVWAYLRAFYQVKFNEIGASLKTPIFAFGKDTKNRVPTQANLPDHDNLRDALAAIFHTKGDNSSDTTLVVPPSQPGSIHDLPTAVETAIGAPIRRRVLIATMEYNITDWNIGVKIGGLGVMAGLMGKNLGHQDLIWVVPCVGGIDYPVDQLADPMNVTIMGKHYEVDVQYHQVANITYVLLDAPVFRKQTKAEPYPARMDDLDSAVYYSAWNQCICQAIERFPIDLYHINDYHGTIAPLYMLPKTIPVCFSLHNAEFQGLWSIRAPEEKEEICGVYNLPPKVVEKYVQFGEVFNLLHAGASYLRIHQKGYGAVGVSNKYGTRALARYPIFWGLHSVGGLPNPDPSDTAPWDKQVIKKEDIVVQEEFESTRGDLRKQAQEWAGLTVDPEAELFVFVGRWSTQKGIDLIADVFFSVLKKNPKVQLVCVGPVIDLYGKFAALKLARLMEIYPGRVYSKPEFTALPPCLFSGAEFALIPSRDEPFGLVAVEFGRKGALGVGARVGGLGQMPGWWYTVESITTSHLLSQFKSAINAALGSKKETRQMMRARSAKQRFPVAQWVEDLEKLQARSIKIHQHQAAKGTKSRPGSGATTPWSGAQTPMGRLSRAVSGFNTPNLISPLQSRLPSRANSRAPSRAQSRASSPNRAGTDEANHSTLPSRTPSAAHSRAHSRAYSRPQSRLQSRASSPSRAGIDEITSDTEIPPLPIFPRAGPGHRRVDTSGSDSSGGDQRRSRNRLSAYLARFSNSSNSTANDLAEDLSSEPDNSDNRMSTVGPLPSWNVDHLQHHSYTPESYPASGTTTPGGPIGYREELPLLDLDAIKPAGGAGKDYNLQKVDPFFKDPTGMYYRNFEKMLGSVDAKTSEGSLAIETYLMKSEKDWFSRYHDAKLGTSSGKTSGKEGHVTVNSVDSSSASSGEASSSSNNDSNREQFEIHEDYVVPTGMKKLMQHKLFGLELYSIILAFGQIMAVNSYQVTLLTGAVGESADKLYAIASVYLAASIIWWVLYRVTKSVYVLALPFFFYGLAFFLLGIGPSCNSLAWAWLNNVATGCYAVGSSSGSLFFALNFGTEGGTPVKTWIFRACVIQGTQQVYIAFLWFWGAKLTANTSNGVASSYITSSPVLAAIMMPIALLLWALGIILYLGLPQYYRQHPGAIPDFYKSFYRRKIIMWFFFTVIIQNYFLSAPYGRNWLYLWSSQHAPAWTIVLLVLAFFIGVWAALMFGLFRLSIHHSWLVPIFAIGLGAPRFAQMLWAFNATYVPWGGPVCGALLGRSLWLWLGVLDAVQGVGFGMILLQTLTRFYVVFVLIAAQVLGSLATIAARASAPDKIGPGSVFPDFVVNPGAAAGEAWFWVVLVLQLVICVGFFAFFRKEQLFKP